MADYSNNQIEEAWQRATTIEGVDPNEWRKDPCGAWINKNEYGKQSPYGWSIDHIIPKVLFENNSYDVKSCNRRAMHWENNNSKADSFPQYNAVVTSDRNKNVKILEEHFIAKSVIDELLKEINGLNEYIRSHEQEWIDIYGKGQVQKWISSNLI